MKDERIPRIIYEQSRARLEQESKEGTIITDTWCEYTKKLLLELKLERYWNENRALDEESWAKVVEERIQEREEKKWLERVNTRDKLRTYRLFKQKLEMEEYLAVRDRCGVPELTRLRGGTNRLKIEKGRYVKIPVEARICEFCSTNEVENEFHFMMICPLYRELRKEMWMNVRPLLPQPCMIYSDEDKFLTLMSAKNRDVIRKVLRYIKQAMKVRRNVEKTREKEEEEKRLRETKK